MPYLNEQALVKLKAYKYASGMSSFLDINIMTPYWNWAVTLLPRWLAPNLITLLALAHGFTASSLLQYHCPTLTEEAPRWVYFFCVYCLFMYQTLDAIDGKQARRTGSSSPLGQLFDHGCDALCCMCYANCVASAICIGTTYPAIAVLMLHLVPFFVSNWEECQTGVMRFGTMGVTEGQFTIMIILLVTGFFGTNIWTTPVIYSMELRYALLCTSVLVVSWQVIDSIRTVLEYSSKHAKDITKGWWQLFTFVNFVAGSVSWSLVPVGQGFLYEHAFRYVFYSIAVSFAYLVSRLIISHVAGMPYSVIFPISYPVPIMILFGSHDITFLGDPVNLARIHFFFVVTTYLYYVYHVIREICLDLNIHCFHIPYVPGDHYADPTVATRAQTAAAAAPAPAAAAAAAPALATPRARTTVAKKQT